jgi:hypothetical protein
MTGEISEPNIAEKMQDLSFEEVHFPVAFQAADQGAIQAKRNFFLASKIELGLILLGAASTSWAIY